MQKKSLTILLFVLFNLSYSFSADKILPFNMGLYLGGNLNMHNPNFTSNTFTNLSNNVNFSNSKNSFGLNVGAIFNYPFNSIFTFSGRIGYNALGTDLVKNDNTLLSSLGYLEISPTVKFDKIIPIDNIYLLGGLEIGIPITKSYSINSSTNTVVPISDLPDANLRIAAVIGAGYNYEIKKNLYLSPEVSFRLPFSKVSNNSYFNSWDIPQLRLGVNLTFGFGKNDDLVESTNSPFDVGFRQVRAYDKNGNKYDVKKISVEQVQYTELFPLLNFTFFDENSSEPNPKYIKLSTDNETGKFSINALEPNSTDINKNTLDIIGTRMQKLKNANLLITGTNDNINEKNNIELSKKRCEIAKNYIVINYGIDASRIKIEARNLPEKPSSSKDKDGIAENRRIEFSSTSKELLQPILIEKEKQTISDPSTLEFIPFVETKDSISSWELTVTQADRNIKSFVGSGHPNILQWTILPNELAPSEIPIEYSFVARSFNDKSGRKSGTIPIEFYSYSKKKSEENLDKTVSKFSLIVFEFDSPNISDFDKDILDMNVLPAIKYNSTIQVFGYSDRIGEEDYNKKLALARADNVKNYLQTKAKGAKFEVFGVGENILLFDNDSPIGRNLSRTVQVYIVTPKEK
ncbi:MAG: OmpA family protein [Candidatus Kapabacteria bacterium]|nr:OmpA family protein [Candidatus Kapabacteria bacterium]